MIYLIVGCYRRLCYELVEYFIDCFRLAVNEEEIRLVFKEAKRRGIFVEVGNSFHHNHSILDSRKVWEAYLQALRAVRTLDLTHPSQEKIFDEKPLCLIKKPHRRFDFSKKRKKKETQGLFEE